MYACVIQFVHAQACMSNLVCVWSHSFVSVYICAGGCAADLTFMPLSQDSAGVEWIPLSQQPTQRNQAAGDASSEEEVLCMEQACARV